MERAARAYYSEAEGWSPFPGYRTQKLRVRGTLPPAIDGVLKAGVELVATSASLAIDASILRFDRLLVVQGRTSPIDVTWKRERRSARERGLVVLVEQGTLHVVSGQRRLQTDAGQIAVIPPGGDPVLIRAAAKTAGVMFSFSANEVEPLSLRWSVSEASVVGESVRALLAAAAADAPQTADPKTANILRALLRAAAQSLVSEATQTVNAREGDALETVRAIVENRFAVAGFAVDDIAREAGLSRRVLERRLQAFGTTPASILRNRRVAEAATLLQADPNLSKREVALRSGFASAITMRRAMLAESAG